MTRSTIKIHCLGDFAVEGLAVDVRGTKQVALLGYLAVNLGKPCSRETLVSIFWGERFNDQARQSLRQALSVLRRAFQACPAGIEIERNFVRLNPERVCADIRQAEVAVETKQLAKAAEIFRRGEFLAALNPKDSGISDWLGTERAKWRDLARRTLLAHGEALLHQDQLVAAQEAADWLMRQDPLDEVAAQLAMRAKAANGAFSEVAKLYRRLCDDLQAELDVKPSADTTGCFNQLRHEASAGLHMLTTNAKGAAPYSDTASDVPLISVETFDFAPETITTKALAADLRSQLIYRLTQRTGIKVLDGHSDQTDVSTYVLKGRLRTSGDQGRLNLSLILREHSRTVFSQNFIGDTSDTFVFCDDLVAQAETQLRVQINAFDGERLTGIPDYKLSVPELRSRAANLLHTATTEGFRGAGQLMDRAVELDPTDPPSLALRANIRIWLSMAGCDELSVAEHEKLGADLNTALEGAHRSDYIYHVRGTFYACCMRDADAALRDGKKALEINPNYALAYNTLGLGYLILGQYPDAVSALRKYVQFSENDPLLAARLYPLAIAQFCNADYRDAVKTIDQAIVLKPNHRLLHRLRAMSLRASGKKDEADAADHEADLLPDTPSMVAVCPPVHPNRSDLLLKTLK